MIFHRFHPSNGFDVAKGSSGICIFRRGTSSVCGGGTRRNLVARYLFWESRAKKKKNKKKEWQWLWGCWPHPGRCWGVLHRQAFVMEDIAITGSSSCCCSGRRGCVAMLEQDVENTKASSFVVFLEATMRVCKWVDSIGLSMCLCLCLSAFLLPSFFLLYSLQDTIRGDQETLMGLSLEICISNLVAQWCRL